MNEYVKHLVECHCSLKIFDNTQKTIYHKFPVFSIINKNDKVEEKYVMCNNCDIIHRVIDVCKSEIKWGKEAFKSLVCTKEDIKFNLLNNDKQNIIDLLEMHNIDISEWEFIDYLLENNKEGQLVLNKEEIEDNIVYKILYVDKNSNIKIKNEIIQRYV